MGKVIVTGGSGFIGSAVVHELVRRRMTDIAVVDNPSALARCQYDVQPSGLEALQPRQFLDMLASDPVAARKIDLIIHLGANSNAWHRNRREMLTNNYLYSRRLIDVSVERRIPLVYASSAAVYGNSRVSAEDNPLLEPLNAYGLSKALLDRYALRVIPSAPVPIAGLRYFNVYGLGEAHKGVMASIPFQFLRQLRESRFIDIFVDPAAARPAQQRRDFIHVRDAVDITLWAALTGRSGIINVGSGRAMTFQEVAELIIERSGFGAIRHVPMPSRLRRGYQWATRAELQKLRSWGYTRPIIAPRTGIRQYIDQLPHCEAS